MDIKKRILVIACAAFISGGMLYSQEPEYKRPEKYEQMQGKLLPHSPEKMAIDAADKMNQLVHLSDKQYEKIYKLYLKWIREDSKKKSDRGQMGGRPGGRGGRGGHGGFGGPRGGMGPGGDMGFGGPGEGGGGRPEGMGQRRPHREGQTPEEMEAQRKKIEKKRLDREKKIKKILSEPQYAVWAEAQEAQRPPRPEGRPEPPKE